MNAGGLQNATAEDILSWTYRRFGRVALVASFQAESLVLIDLACRIVSEPEVLTLDTGRLHEETHDYIEYVRRQFPIRLRILAPDAGELEAMTGEHGDMLFRQSVPLRNQCCAVRKVNPLARALRDYDAWITGLRRDQTPTRAATPVVASDPGHDGMIKWSRWRAGRGIRCRTTSASMASGATRSMTAATCRSGARRAPARPGPANRSEQAAGGGRATHTRSACCTRRSRRQRSTSPWECR
jgi:phosphoadenylyl-sulfate reductase (thioredoxin)